MGLDGLRAWPSFLLRLLLRGCLRLSAEKTSRRRVLRKLLTISRSGTNPTMPDIIVRAIRNSKTQEILAVDDFADWRLKVRQIADHSAKIVAAACDGLHATEKAVRTSA